MQPTIGRIVHYQSYGTAKGEYLPEPRAAIITEVHDATEGDPFGPISVSLCILNPTGLFFNTSVCYADEPTPGCWNWPPRT